MKFPGKCIAIVSEILKFTVKIYANFAISDKKKHTDLKILDSKNTIFGIAQTILNSRMC